MTPETMTPDVAHRADEPIVRLRHPWRWVAVVVIALYAAQPVVFAATSDEMRWDLVGGYLFEESILRGVWMTVKLTVVAMLVGISLGTVLAVMRLSDNPVFRALGGAYVWLFRGTPIVVQLLFWFFLGTVLPEISLGLPFGPDLISGETSQVITPFLAAILGLGLNEGAYMAEIVRAGIGSVDKGQKEAAEALGHEPVHDVPPRDPAAGRAADRAADREPDDLDAQAHLAGARHRPAGADHDRADHLRPQLPADPAADRRQHLVPRADHVLTIVQCRLERRLSRSDRGHRGPAPRRLEDDEGARA